MERLLIIIAGVVDLVMLLLVLEDELRTRLSRWNQCWHMNKLSTNQWLAIKANAQCWLDHVHDTQWKTKAMISSYLQLDYITISEPIARRNDALDTQVRSANASRCLPLCWPSFRFWLMNNRDWRETFEKDFHSVFNSFWWYWTAKKCFRFEPESVAWRRSRRDKTRKRSLTFNLHFRRAFVAARMANFCF